MEVVTNFKSVWYRDCRDLNQLGIEFTMTFQPIVNFQEKSIFGYEVLVREPSQVRESGLDTVPSN